MTAGDAPPAGPATLAEARWSTAEDGEPPRIAGFVVSSFSPITAAVADRCLRAVHGTPQTADADRLARTGLVLASAGGDAATAEAVAQAVAEGRKVPPLLFFQSNPNAVAGHIAARWGLRGPVACVRTAADGEGAPAEALAAAELLLLAGEADEVLTIAAEADEACARLLTSLPPSAAPGDPGGPGVRREHGHAAVRPGAGDGVRAGVPEPLPSCGHDELGTGASVLPSSCDGDVPRAGSRVRVPPGVGGDVRAGLPEPLSSCGHDELGAGASVLPSSCDGDAPRAGSRVRVPPGVGGDVRAGASEPLSSCGHDELGAGAAVAPSSCAPDTSQVASGAPTPASRSGEGSPVPAAPSSAYCRGGPPRPRRRPGAGSAESPEHPRAHLSVPPPPYGPARPAGQPKGDPYP